MTEDIDHIMEVMEAAFDPAWGEAWNRRQVSDSLAFPANHYILVDTHGRWPEEGGTAAGFVLSRHTGGEEELLLIAVRPEHRGRGLGSGLIDSFCTAAKARGADSVFLEMRTNNPARLLYEARGFTPIGRRPDYYRLPNGRRLDAITFGMAI